MSLKTVKTSIIVLCLLALAVPLPAKAAVGEMTDTPPAAAFVSTESNPSTLQIGQSASVSVKLNNVPAEGYKSAEFTCTYNGGLLEKSNIAVTELFGADAVPAIHDPQNGIFIAAIAGANSNRATSSGPAFTFSVKALQAGQSQILCSARVSRGDNLPMDLPGVPSDLIVLDAAASPTPDVLPTVTMDHHEHSTATSPVIESPTPLPAGSVSGQILASKPVTVRLLDANQMEVASALANPDGTFVMTPPPGDYTFVATASGFLSYQGAASVTAGNDTVFPAWSLLAGDVDGNNVIDQFDALTIGMSYMSAIPEAANLNNDAVIDFLDLELLAENYRQTGPTTGSPSIMGLFQRGKPTAIYSPTPGATKIVIPGSPAPETTKTMIAPVITLSPFPFPQTTVIAPTATQQTVSIPDVPLCPTHDPTKWHGLWDRERGCHYDHEHGTTPFTAEVAAAFPGFNLIELLGGVGIGHTNPSSPMENTHKHGGFKWQVDLAAPQGCNTGFEDGTVAVNAYAIQFHAFGRQDIEHEARNHSSTALLKFCKPDNPSDVGYMYVVQLQEFGERALPYQGLTLQYPDNFSPQWYAAFGPYFTTECFGSDFTADIPEVGPKLIDCRPTFDDNSNNLTIWTSKKTGNGPRPEGSRLFNMLFRGRDNYQRLDVTDLVHPFTWMFVCGGANYNPTGCKYNSSTMTIHEVAGDIPAAWDGLAGFDTDPRPGRITAQGFVTRFGDLNPACTVAGGDCYPIKLVSAFVGRYSSEVSVEKVSNPTPADTPERDIYFCAGVQCRETDPGAIPSGWIGSEN